MCDDCVVQAEREGAPRRSPASQNEAQARRRRESISRTGRPLREPAGRVDGRIGADALA